MEFIVIKNYLLYILQKVIFYQYKIKALKIFKFNNIWNLNICKYYIILIIEN